MKKTKKSKLFINSTFQIRFIIFSIFLALITIGLFEISQWYLIYNLKQEGVLIGLSKDHTYFQFIKDIERTVNITGFIYSIILLTLFFFLSFFYSQKMAKIIFQIKSKLNKKTMDNL